MRTQAWQHKTLNTQAASRAELRHDTLLYVKQSYSGGITCEYPDGYVEPLAGFYDRMAHLGTLGEALVDDIEAAGYESPHAREYFVHWSAVMTNLQGIAEQELAGQQLTGEQIAFLGQTVEQETVGCGEIAWDGWYPGLFYDTGTLGVSEPTIADVHTAPTDASGNDKGWVLHAATGKPMLMVLTVPSCDGEPAAYIGPISSQFSVLTEGYSRLTDSQWAEQLFDENPARPSWTGSFIP
jgi:hypothetical protein